MFETHVVVKYLLNDFGRAEINATDNWFWLEGRQFKTHLSSGGILNKTHTYVLNPFWGRGLPAV